MHILAMAIELIWGFRLSCYVSRCPVASNDSRLLTWGCSCTCIHAQCSSWVIFDDAGISRTRIHLYFDPRQGAVFINHKTLIAEKQKQKKLIRQRLMIRGKSLSEGSRVGALVW